MKTLAPHLQRGIAAEESALKFLQTNGLRLLEKNYRCRYGELDLVMLDQQELVVVEVRYRRSEQFGGAASSVDFAKRKKLRRSAESFLHDYEHIPYRSCRFDVVALRGAPPFQIDWLQDAF